MENADKFDSKCSEYVTFAPRVLLLDWSETAQRSATAWCIQVHYFRSVAAATSPDRAPDPANAAGGGRSFPLPASSSVVIVVIHDYWHWTNYIKLINNAIITYFFLISHTDFWIFDQYTRI